MTVNRRTALKIRKTHRYLGLFLGIQFLFWTISGLYFSWTNIDDIHGDQLKKTKVLRPSFDNLISPDSLKIDTGIKQIVLRDIAGEPYYWINNSDLYHARTALLKEAITPNEAIQIANKHIKPNLVVDKVARIDKAGPHYEYRERLLPVYVISYKSEEAIKAYVSVADGKFQTVRHRSWRWFDFLWMTHTMDYQTRDNFNTTVLRAFSLLGLITVSSGLLLWFTSSPRIQKFLKRFQ